MFVRAVGDVLGGVLGVQGASVPAASVTATARPSVGLVALVFGGEELLDRDDKGENESDLGDDESFSGQEEEETDSDGDEHHQLHADGHHHHSHSLVLLATHWNKERSFVLEDHLP